MKKISEKQQILIDKYPQVHWEMISSDGTMTHDMCGVFLALNADGEIRRFADRGGVLMSEEEFADLIKGL